MEEEKSDEVVVRRRELQKGEYRGREPRRDDDEEDNEK